MNSNKTILFTAPFLKQEAQDLLRAEGYDVLLTEQGASTESIAQMASNNPVVAIISRSIVLDERVYKVAKHLKVICKHGTGVDNIDVKKATKYGIIVAKTTGVNARSVAEHTLALILASSRRLRNHANSVANGDWDRNRWQGQELSNKTLCLIGFGHIGKHLLHISKNIFAQVSVYDPYSNKEIIRNLGGTPVSLDEAIKSSDVISLHCPLTPETMQLINNEIIAKMKKGSIIINTARGEIINEQDVLNGLNNKHLFAVGLDSLVNEQADNKDLLRQHDHATVTPHIGASTQQAMENVAIQAVENTLSLLKGNDIAEYDRVN